MAKQPSTKEQSWLASFRQQAKWAHVTDTKSTVKIIEAGPYCEVKFYGRPVLLPTNRPTAIESSNSVGSPDNADRSEAASASSNGRTGQQNRRSGSDSSPRTPEQNHYRHVKRSQARLKLLVNANFDPRTAVFVTLSFKVKQFRLADVKRLWGKLAKRLRKNVDGVKYLALPEMHEDGSWHIHVVLDRQLPLNPQAMAPYVAAGKIKGKGGTWESLWKLGQVHCKKLDAGGNLGASIAAYLLKNAHVPDLARCHGVWRSDNLAPPVELTGQAALARLRELESSALWPVHSYSVSDIDFIGSLSVYEFCTDPKAALLYKAWWKCNAPAA